MANNNQPRSFRALFLAGAGPPPSLSTVHAHHQSIDNKDNSKPNQSSLPWQKCFTPSFLCGCSPWTTVLHRTPRQYHNPPKPQFAAATTTMTNKFPQHFQQHFQPSLPRSLSLYTLAQQTQQWQNNNQPRSFQRPFRAASLPPPSTPQVLPSSTRPPKRKPQHGQRHHHNWRDHDICDKKESTISPSTKTCNCLRSILKSSLHSQSSELFEVDFYDRIHLHLPNHQELDNQITFPVMESSSTFS